MSKSGGRTRGSGHRSGGPARAGAPAAPAGAALQRQASALFQAGRLAEAAALCRKLVAREPRRPDIAAFAGLVALKRGELAEAARLYERAVALRPEYAEAHFNLGNALKGLKRLDEAAAAFRRAGELRPELAPAHHNLGSVLQSLDRLDEAAAAYRRTLALAPNAVETLRNLGMVLQRLGQAGEALALFRQALALRPGWLLVYSNLVTALMEMGDARAAVAACEEWLSADPDSTEALARLAVAQIESGDRASARTLLDFDRFVREIRFEAPAGYASLADFNKALAEHVAHHPTLKVPPEDDPTYHHPRLQITEELLGAREGPTAAFEAMIRQAVAEYRSSIAGGPPHPFLASWPERWRLSCWAIVLNGEGNLVPHIHIEGYLGGVYYPELPEVVRAGAGDGDRAGWFELGRPPPELNCTAAPEVRAIQPEEGKMLVFPAYFYHRTLPFQSAERRISVAFDLVPER